MAAARRNGPHDFSQDAVSPTRHRGRGACLAKGRYTNVAFKKESPSPDISVALRSLLAAILIACVSAAAAAQQSVATPRAFQTNARFTVDSDVLQLQTALQVFELASKQLRVDARPNPWRVSQPPRDHLSAALRRQPLPDFAASLIASAGCSRSGITNVRLAFDEASVFSR